MNEETKQEQHHRLPILCAKTRSVLALTEEAILLLWCKKCKVWHPISFAMLSKCVAIPVEQQQDTALH